MSRLAGEQELRRILLLPLGQTAARARDFATIHYAGASIEELDRSLFRRAPLVGLGRLLDSGYDEFVLYAPDLESPRLRWTKALALVARARKKWVTDDHGRLQRFRGLAYLGQEAPAAAGRLVAVGSMLVVAPATFSLLGLWLSLERRLRARRFSAAGARRKQLAGFLRTQFWFGLQAGGSVAHTSGVIGGLEEDGCSVLAIASDTLSGVRSRTVVIRPQVWFDGALRELEECLFNVRFVREAWRVLRRERPAWLYQRYTALSVAGPLLSRWLRVPLVLEFNSSDVWKARYWGEFRLLPLVRLGEWVNLLAADVIVVVSEVLRDELVAQGVPPGRILVNPNGVDPESFRPDIDAAAVRARHGLAGKVVVGFSGTFGVWHGIPTLAEMLPLVAAARPDIHFLIIGDGPLRPVLEKAIARHGLRERVTMTGMVPHAEAPAYLAACDVLVAPHGRQADGREFFGSPTKLFEYMAMGRAIVATRVGQMARVLRHGDNGWLIEPESASALAEAILHLAQAPELRERLGQSARRDALQRHSWRQNAWRLLEAVQRLYAGEVAAAE